MKPHLRLLTLILIYSYFLSNRVVLSVHIKALCPIMCKCYIDDATKLKTVECVGRNLINPNIEAPVKTERLDLSNNMITTLDKGSFEGLFQLTSIYLYSNTIATVYSDTFLRLKKLSFVDLSSNRIEEIEERLFDTNRLLKTVVLSYNKFANLFNRPFLISDSIEILNLKKCQISYVHSETFKHLPRLKALDLSSNLLATVNVQHMKPLKVLNWLDLNGNPWKCDKSMEMVRQWSESNHILMFLMECASKPVSKFERMVEAPKNKSNPESTELNDEDYNIEDWLIDNEENNPKTRDYDDPRHIHEMLTECQERLVILSTEQQFLSGQKKFNLIKSVIFFMLGFLCGLLLSTSLFFIITAGKTERKWEQRQYERERSRTADDEVNETANLQIISSQVEPPPLPPRRRRHPMRSLPPQRPKKSFFASLFERRRVYHRIHPPNLIRRLSRSNLFSSTFGLNRSESRPRLDRQSSRRQNSNNNPPNDGQIPGRAPTNGQPEVATPVVVIHQKPETPPPTYNECMITFDE